MRAIDQYAVVFITTSFHYRTPLIRANVHYAAVIIATSIRYRTQLIRSSDNLQRYSQKRFSELVCPIFASFNYLLSSD
jgi:hypothetical protein